jgi:hypothetical protein
MQAHTDAAPHTLNGWKEIAGYLGKSVRSAQRWEMTLGLPIHRIKTPDAQIVYAHAHEIDEWRRQLEKSRGADWEQALSPADAAQTAGDGSSVLTAPPATGPVPTAPGPRHTMLGTAAVLLLLTGAIGGWWVARPEALAVEVRYVGRSVEALASDGTLVWKHTFDTDISAPRRAPTFVDLDDDGEAEVLVPIRRLPNGAAVVSDALVCFTRRGEVRWTVAPDNTLTFGGHAYSAPWSLRDFAIASTRGPRAVWIAYAHHTWFPGLVLQVNPDGSRLLKYVQAGALYSIAHWPTAAGSFLAIGGTSEEHEQATLALIPDSASPASFPVGVPSLACEHCPQGRPSRLLLIAPAELTRANNEVFPYVVQLQVVGASLKLTIADGPGRSVASVEPDFSLQSLQFGQRYWAAHKSLEGRAQIDHATEDCPDRLKPRQVREWTPDSGWRTTEVLPLRDTH